MRVISMLLVLFWDGAVWAQALDVPIYEMVGDGQAATCGVSEIVGLKADGDGFLAVRSGPGSNYRKLAELHNGDRVTAIDQHGNWLGIAYGDGKLDQDHLCANDGPRRQITGQGIGWVHKNWVNYLYP